MSRLVRVVCATVAVCTLGGCSHGGGSARSKARVPSSTSTTAAPEFKLVVASIDVQSMKPGVDKLPADVESGVKAALDNYMSKAIVEPLTQRQAAVGLDAAFTPVALARLGSGSPDRAALVEEPPAAAGALAPEKEDASLTALANQDGGFDVVTAKLDFAVVFTGPTGRLHIERTGEVALIPVPGGWRIDSYDVAAKRDSMPAPAPATSTTGKKK